MYIDAPSVKTWHSFITHGEGAMMSHHFLGEGDLRHDAHSSSEDESSFWRSWIMYIDAPSVTTWRSFITHGEGAMMSHHFRREGDLRHDAHSSYEDESSSWCSWVMYIDAPSVKTWRSFITHGEGAMVSYHFLGKGEPASWRPFIIWGWVIILMLMNHVHWCTQCQNMMLIYHPWRGGNGESSFSGGEGPQTWRSFIIWGWVIILMTLNLKYGANMQRCSLIFWTTQSK